MIAVRRALRLTDAFLLVVTAAGVLVGALTTSTLYGIIPHLEFSVFYLLALTWLCMMWRICAEMDCADRVEAAFRTAIPLSFAYLLIAAAISLIQGGDYRGLGFDDKSHAALFASALAFLSLRFLRSPTRLVLALGFVLISMMTLSRLPVLIAPFFLVAFICEYRKVRREATTPLQVYGAHLLLSAAVVTPAILITQVGDLFSSLNRAFTATGSASQSTDAHILLLEYGARLKVENVANLAFGVTPRGFASALAQSDVDISEYSVIDPGGYAKILLGVAPMHSSVGTIFVEFPIWIFALFVVGIGWSLIRLISRRDWVMLSFLVGYFLATTLYSSLTELYFYVAITAVILVCRRPLTMARIPEHSPSGLSQVY